MFLKILILIFSVFISTAYAETIPFCEPPQPHEGFVDKSSVQVVKNSSEALHQFNSIYENSHRLRNRVYWSREKRSFVYRKNNQEHLIPNSFLLNVRNQITQALLLKYADFLYYADLGHFHILAPESQKSWSLSDTNLLNLYHTGELYQFKKNGTFSNQLNIDPHWLWLYKMRNFVGKNENDSPIVSVFAPQEAFYNTVRRIDGYKEVGSAYMSSNKNGCFKLITNNPSLNWRFDLSIEL